METKADSTGSGTPNSYNAATSVEIGIIPLQGVYGDTTVHFFLESNYFAGWDHYTTYFAYKLVFIPDTTGVDNPDSPGYSTYYFSQNSDAIDVYQNVIGSKENRKPIHQIPILHVFPNPFFKQTRFLFFLDKTGPVKLTVYDESGQLVRTIIDETRAVGAHAINFKGIDENKIPLPRGVYFFLFHTNKQQYVGKIIRL